MYPRTAPALCLTLLTLVVFGNLTSITGRSIEALGDFRPTGLSGDGSVIVGMQTDTQVGIRAVLFVDGTLKSFEQGVEFRRVSGDGQVLGGQRQTGEIIDDRAEVNSFLWTREGFKAISPSWGQFGDGVNAMSSDGSVVFGYALFDANAATFRESAYRWQDGGFEQISIEKFTRIGSTNADGSVYAGSTGPFFREGHRAVVWSDDAVIYQGVDGTSAQVTASGNLVAINHPDGAFLWEPGAGTETPVGGIITSLNEDGTLVVGYEQQASAPFLWSAEKGRQDLGQALRNDFGIATEGWEFLRSFSQISDDGTVLTGYGRKSGGNLATWRANLSPSPLAVELRYTDRPDPGSVYLDETVTLGMTVTARSSLEGPLTEVAFEDAMGLVLPDQFEIVTAPESTAIGTLEPGESWFTEWELKAIKLGRFTFRNHPVLAVDVDGDPVASSQAELNGSVPGFDVEIVLPEETLMLEAKEDDGEDDGEPSETTGFEPLEFEVKVRITVPENGDPIENVTFQGFDASDGGLDIDLVMSTGLEDEPWVDVQPQPVPAPVGVSTPSEIGVLPDTLQPGGEPGEFTVTVTATRPGQFDIAALITAGPVGGGDTITGRGTNVADIKGDLILSMQLEVVNQPARITEGESVEISGIVENLSLTETLKLDPLLVISSGQGVPRGPVQIDEELPLAGTPGIFNPTLEPGQWEQFRLRIDTVSLPGFDQRELVGRESVVVDFALSGTIIDTEGEERDLEPSATLVEWGNGRHDVSGATFLRAEVTPDLKASRLLSPDDFYTIAAGDALENLVLGGWDLISGVPSMLGSLPPARWGLANINGQLFVESQFAVYNASRYLWAWTDMQAGIWFHLDEATRQQQMRLITDELTLYFGDHFDSADQVRQIVNSAITDYFVKVDDYQRRAYDASSFGFNAELAEIAAEPFRPLGSLALEELAAAAAVAAWVSKVSRSTEIAEQVAKSKNAQRAAAAEDATEATQAMARIGDPRVTEMPSPMRALRHSTPLNQKHAVDGFGVDPVSDANLIRMTDAKRGGMPIFVAIRSRADETIEWMKTQLGIVPKPMTFKPKNVNADDVKYLGYRDGVGYGDANGVGAGDRGATLLAEPIPRDVVIQRLEGVDEVTRKRVLDRHADRWDEWYGHKDFASRVIDKNESKFWELSNKMPTAVDETGRIIKTGRLDVPRRGSVPQPDINLDTVGPGILDSRLFELRQVKNPPDNALFPEGRQYFECWLEDDLGTDTLLGTLRRIAGDIDTVAVGLADGSALPVAHEFSETVAKNMLHGIQAQHPWSSSLSLEKLFEKFVNNRTHRWHPDPAERGEPLLIYVNGERRVGWLHPTRAITKENPLKGFMWVDGGTADVDNVVRFQKDLRGSLADVSKVNPPMVKPITTRIRDAFLDFDLGTGSDRVATCAINTARTGGILFRLSRNNVFEKRNDEGTWEEADPAAGCGDGQVVVVPETFLSMEIPEGAAILPILEDALGFDWKEMFALSDQVIINPGGDTEEHRRVVDHGSLVLDRPLTFAHPAGTRIVSLGPSDIDLDADGLTNDQEDSLGTNPVAPDTDGDGVDDGTEVRLGTDPLVPNAFPGPDKEPLIIRLTSDGQLELTSPADSTGTVETSLSLENGSWTPALEFEQPDPNEPRFLLPLDAPRRFYRVRRANQP